MRASLWLLLYSSIPTVVIGTMIVSSIYVYDPELFLTIGTAAGQRNLSWFPSLVFNPLLESLIIAMIIKISVKLKAKKRAIIISAIFLSALHSLQNPLWGITVFCFFLIQSYAFFYGFSEGLKKSYLTISISHSLHNAWILAFIFFLEKSA
jgi:hypothetical protein